eukprot:gene18702-25225_t
MGVREIWIDPTSLVGHIKPRGPSRTAHYIMGGLLGPCRAGSPRLVSAICVRPSVICDPICDQCSAICVRPSASVFGHGYAYRGLGNAHLGRSARSSQSARMPLLKPFVPSIPFLKASAGSMRSKPVILHEAASSKTIETTSANSKQAVKSTGLSSHIVPSASDEDARFDAMSTFEMQTDPEVAGQIETVAATYQNNAIARAARAAKAAADARGTRSSKNAPYKSPSSRWSNIKGYSTFRRTTEIWYFAFLYAIKYFLVKKKWTYGKELAIWLRKGLVSLGPTFIKIGQQFSTRVDVLAPEFIKELEKLQVAIQILESGLGAKTDQVFDSFDKVPLAAASLGQVHRAVVKGQEVVVKIQRPGLKALFDIDCKNIRALAVWLQKTDPGTDGAKRDWVAIYDECSCILYQEIDYTLEGRNADRFRENFKHVSWVKVPKVFWEYSSAEVLVLEYVPGVKINDGQGIDRMGLDRQQLARKSVESYLMQLTLTSALLHELAARFFHADPHPGNVAVDAVGGGRLIYYDFGMVGDIPPKVKSGLMGLFYSVYNRDPDLCLESLVDMGVYVPTGDRTAIRRTAEFFLDTFTERLSAQKKERQELGADYNKNFKEQRTKEETKELLVSQDQPFRFPATLTFVARSFSVLDGIGKTLDPRFDNSGISALYARELLLEISAPYARELLLENEGNAQLAKVKKDISRRFSNQNRAVGNLFRSPNRLEDAALTLQKMERGDLKLRVRALETERALSRVQLMQRVIAAALAASALVNMGTVLYVSAVSGPSTACFLGAAAFAVITLINFMKVSSLEKKEMMLMGAA